MNLTNDNLPNVVRELFNENGDSTWTPVQNIEQEIEEGKSKIGKISHSIDLIIDDCKDYLEERLYNNYEINTELDTLKLNDYILTHLEKAQGGRRKTKKHKKMRSPHIKKTKKTFSIFKRSKSMKNNKRKTRITRKRKLTSILRR
jgi:hypothetical protein